MPLIIRVGVLLVLVGAAYAAFAWVLEGLTPRRTVLPPSRPGRGSTGRRGIRLGPLDTSWREGSGRLRAVTVPPERGRL